MVTQPVILQSSIPGLGFFMQLSVDGMNHRIILQPDSMKPGISHACKAQFTSNKDFLSQTCQERAFFVPFEYFLTRITCHLERSKISFHAISCAQ